MPKKFNDYDDDSDYLSNIPITERITTPQTDPQSGILNE